MSLRARLLNAWLRRVERPAMERAKDPEALRRRFAFQARLLFHPPRGTQMRWTSLADGQRQVDALEVTPRRLHSDLVLLYFHGGGFVFGSPDTHSAMMGALAARLGARVLLPRYRLAPEHAFPAAIDDALTAWDGLLASGVSADHVFVGGDSAGGALALSLLGQLLARGAALPAGVFGLSPLTDLTFSGPSFSANAGVEAVLPASRAQEMSGMYLNGQPPEDPRVSPHFAPFKGACPVWLTAGDTEILRDDSRRLAQRLGDEKVDVTFEEHPDLPHVWPIFHNTLPEARASLDSLARWIRQKAPPQGEN